MRPQRERFWGLYDYDRRMWERHSDGKRVRYPNALVATTHMMEEGSVPRPFYVVRKPRALSALSLAAAWQLAAVVKSYLDDITTGSCAFITPLEQAVRKFEETRKPCGISSSS